MKLIVGFLVLFCGAWMPFQDEYDKLLILVKKESDQIASTLNLYPFGFGIKGPGEIKGITLSFKSYEGLDVDKARGLIVQLVEKLINQINFEINQEKLDRVPVDLSFFYIQVSFPGKKTMFNEVEGELALIDVSKGVINYEIRKPGNPNFIPVYSEPYEEAYRKVLGNQ